MQMDLNQKVDKAQAELWKRLDIFAIPWIYLVDMQVG